MSALQRTIIVLLASSIVALLYAPLLMPESYNWIVHTTSESGAQAVDGAWLARTGFVLYGVAVLLLVMLMRRRWSSALLLVHGVFGICMIGNAVFSSKPWDKSMPFDLLEDTLHSWMSGLVGTAFSLGVLMVFFRRARSEYLSKGFDVFAILVAIAVSITMMGSLGVNGLVQRLMFFVSYLWYGKEALSPEEQRN